MILTERRIAMRNTYTLRALSVFLSITLLMSLFSACGAETKTPQDDEPATTVATEENIPESSDDYIITSWEGCLYIALVLFACVIVYAVKESVKSK